MKLSTNVSESEKSALIWTLKKSQSQLFSTTQTLRSNLASCGQTCCSWSNASGWEQTRPHSPLDSRPWPLLGADFLAAPHQAHLCSEHFSECDFANPMEYRMGFVSKLTRCSSTLSKSCLTGSNWYGCILAGSLWQSISFVFGARAGHFAATPQSDVVGIWSRDLGVMATLSVRQKMPVFVRL